MGVTMKRVFLISLTLLLIILFGFWSIMADNEKAEPTVDDILARYIAAIGGRAAIDNVTSRDCVGKVITDLTSRQRSTLPDLW